MSRLYTDNITKFIAYYTRYPDKLLSYVYGIKLYWWQRMVLKMMYRHECAKEAIKRMNLVALRELTIQSMIDEIYNKYGCDPMYYANDDTAEGKQAKLDAAIIEWLRAHLGNEVL